MTVLDVGAESVSTTETVTEPVLPSVTDAFAIVIAGLSSSRIEPLAVVVAPERVRRPGTERDGDRLRQLD